MTKGKKNSKKSSELIEETSITIPGYTQIDKNIEKWSFWQPAKSKEKQNVITIEREVIQSNNNKFTAKVEITSNSKYGPLTTEDQKVYYALQKIWNETGRQDRIFFSRRKLARMLNKTWCEDTLNAIENSLYRLRGTLFIWTNAYYDSATERTIERLDAFNVLSFLELDQERVGGRSLSDNCSCEFHELIYNNIQNGYTKPLPFETIIGFEDGIAQILYSYLDFLMLDKCHYESRTKELFNELQLKGKTYKNTSNRKQTLTRVFPKLQNIELSKGGLLKLALEKTQDKQDYKLIANKEQKENLLPPAKKEPSEVFQQQTFGYFSEPETPEITSITSDTLEVIPSSEPSVYQHPIDQTEQLENIFQTLVAEELVAYFLELFKIGRKKSRPRELEEARRLVIEHKLDFDKCKHFANFSFNAARNTGYSPRSLTGIVQYVEEALEHYKESALTDNNEKEIINFCRFCEKSNGYLYVEKIGKPAGVIKCPHSLESVRAEIRNGTKFKMHIN